MRFLLPWFLVCSCLLMLLPGCEPKEDMLTASADARLEFSADTVFFDTVFVQTGSVTKRLWAYNRNSRAVKVETITLGTPTNSPYTIIVNGDQGAVAKDVEIRGKDSLLILVRTTITPGQADVPFLVEDKLRFRTNGNDQDVNLRAFGQNAYFHQANDVLPCRSVWRNDKPHVVLGAVGIGAGCTLTMEEGTRVFFHAGGALIVKGSLLVNPRFDPGSEEVKADDPRIVRFAGDRREAYYNDVPGQWAGIQFDSTSSRNNVVRYAEIKNASFGLLVYNPGNQVHPKVTVANTVIKNISGAALNFASGTTNGFDGAGVLSIGGDFDLQNCLFTNCGEYAIRATSGGVYNLNFCTIANYTPSFGLRKTAALTFSNLPAVGRVAGPLPLQVDIRNSIVWGSVADELEFENSNQYRSTLLVRNSLLRTQAYKAEADASDKPGLANAAYRNVLNVAPNFKRASDSQRPAYDKFDYRLDTLSAASNRPLLSPLVPRDMLNNARDANAPDLGAYERLNP